MNTESKDAHVMHESTKSVQTSGVTHQKHTVGKASRKRILKKQECGVCGKNMLKQNLKQHMIVKHADVVDSICGKKVNWKTSPRKYHRKIVDCKSCGKSMRSDNLKHHMARKHVDNLYNTVDGSENGATQTVEMDEMEGVSKLSRNILAPVEQKIVNIIEKAITDVANQVKQEFVTSIL